MTPGSGEHARLFDITDEEAGAQAAAATESQESDPPVGDVVVAPARDVAVDREHETVVLADRLDPVVVDRRAAVVGDQDRLRARCDPPLYVRGVDVQRLILRR